MAALAKAILVLLLTPSLTTSVAIPQHGLPRESASSSVVQAGPTSTCVHDIWNCSKNVNSSHQKRVLPVSHKKVVDTEICMKTGFQLTKMMWADEKEAQVIYKAWRETDEMLKAPVFPGSELQEYWSWEASEQKWSIIFQGQNFQNGLPARMSS